MTSLKFQNVEPFDPEYPTFQNVMLEAPPVMGPQDGTAVVDNTDTFGDVPGNEGDIIELPVPGYVAAQPHVEVEVHLSRITGGPILTAQDFHIPGKNLELTSSYAPNALANGQWVTYAQVESWKGTQNIINPDAGFTRETLLGWMDEFIPQGGYSVFRNHAFPGSPFFTIYRDVLHALGPHPRWMNFYKAQRASILPGFRGFVPKSYSCVEDSMGVSWGTSEYFAANEVKRIWVSGTCLDICPKESVRDYARKGWEVWYNVDSGAVLKLPIDGVVTTEHLALRDLLQFENVHFYSTALKMRSHQSFIQFLPTKLRDWANELAYQEFTEA